MSLTSPLTFPEDPFQDIPDRKFVFLSPTHEALLKELIDFIHRRQGLALVVGEEGVGKTTLISVLVERLRPHYQTVVLSPPGREPLALVKAVASSLGVALREPYRMEVTSPAEALRQHLQAGRPSVAILDDAHTLTDAHLLDLWLLSQMEHQGGVLLPFVLVGRRGLLKKVDSRSHERLRPLIRARLTLPPLSPKETFRYLDHRLRQVGSSFAACFTSECSGPLFATTGGIPRLINQRAREALARAQKEGLSRVTRAQLSTESPVLAPAEEVPPQPWFGQGARIAFAGILIFLGICFAFYQGWHRGLFSWPSGFLGPAGKGPGDITVEPKTPTESHKPAKPGSPPPPPETGRQPAPQDSLKEATYAAKAPEQPLATYQVAPADHLFKIADKVFPEQPRLGVAALILANPDLKEEDTLYPGQVLRLPELKATQNLIRIEGKYFYLARRFFGPTPELSRLLNTLKENEVQFLVRETSHPGFRKIYRVFIGGYDSPEEIQKALAKVGIK